MEPGAAQVRSSSPLCVRAKVLEPGGSIYPGLTIHDLCTCALFRVGAGSNSRLQRRALVGVSGCQVDEAVVEGGVSCPHDPPPLDPPLLVVVFYHHNGPVSVGCFMLMRFFFLYQLTFTVLMHTLPTLLISAHPATIAHFMYLSW